MRICRFRQVSTFFVYAERGTAVLGWGAESVRTLRGLDLLGGGVGLALPGGEDIRSQTCCTSCTTRSAHMEQE